MPKGITIKCSRCLTGYNIYDDIQVKAVGICPVCNNTEGFNFEHPFTFEYNAGNVESHIEEPTLEWEPPRTLSLEEAGLEDKPSSLFDQDYDFIAANLGWD